MSTVVVLAMHGVPPSDFPRGELLKLLGREVVVAFNEFCAPSVGEAFERTTVLGATREDQIKRFL